MRIALGVPNQGLGQDPKQSREERAAELRALDLSNAGKDVIAHYFIKYTGGGLSVRLPPPGVSFIDVILAHEYPQLRLDTTRIGDNSDAISYRHSVQCVQVGDEHTAHSLVEPAGQSNVPLPGQVTLVPIESLQALSG